MIKTLYEISADFERIADMCYDDSISEQEIQDSLAQLEGELTEKVADGIAVIQELKATAEATATEIARLTQNKKRLEARADSLKRYYLEHLTRVGKNKVTTERGTMCIAKVGGLKPLKIDDEDLIPLDFKRIVSKAEIDKDALRKALERGDEITGAHLEERGKYLRIS